MSLKFEIDSLDGLDETQKAFYVEKDGKYRLAVDGLPEPEDTASLKSALQKERKAAADAAKRAKQYEGLGLSAEEIAELVEARKKAEEDKAKNAGEWDKLKNQLNEKHQNELKQRDQSVASMKATLEKYLINSQAVSAIAAEKGIPELLLPHVQRFTRVVEQDGEYAVQIVDAKGDPRINAKGEPLTISDLIQEMKADVKVFGRAFEGSGQSGSGTQPNSGSGGTPGNGGDAPKSYSGTDEEKAAYLRNKLKSKG